MAAFSPVFPAVNIAARLEKLKASPQICLMMLLMVWDISSLRDTDGCDRIVVIEAEFLQGFVCLFNIFDFFNNPVKTFFYYFLKSHKSPKKDSE